AFASEFLILAGILRQGWGWAVVGAVAIVLAAMYIVRMISGVLHQDVGSAVPDAALDLRPGELAIVVPLVGLLLALSAWPAAISERAFASDRPAQSVRTDLARGTSVPTAAALAYARCQARYRDAEIAVSTATNPNARAWAWKVLQRGCAPQPGGVGVRIDVTRAEPAPNVQAA